MNFVYVLSIIVAAVFFDSDEIPATDPNSKFLTLLFWATLLGACLIVVLTLAKAKVEREFWEVVKEVEEMFELNLGMDFYCGKFNRVCGWKFVMMLLSVLISEVLMAIYLKTSRHTALVETAILRNVLKVITRFIVIKYIFYVDVLRVCLKNIERKLTRTKIIRKGDLRILKKVYALCWRLSYMIEDIFGWGIAYVMLLLFAAATFNGHDICYNYARGNMNFSPFVPLFFKTLTVWALALSCKKCVDSSVKIASLAFSINSELFHKIVEEFALQIMHQRIKFEPKTFFNVDYELVISVSKNSIHHLTHF